MKTIFESERINYVKVNEDLINDYLEMVNDPLVANKISHNPISFTYEQEKEWIKIKLAEDAKVFSMIEKSTGDYIGNIEVMEPKDGISELGITITPKKQNMLYGREAMKRIMKYAEEELGINNFELNVYKTNPKAIKCYENSGFVIDGDGKTEEDYHMSYKRV